MTAHSPAPVSPRTTSAHKTNFIKNIIEEDLASHKHQTVITRFPPEPNGYLHVGHAKSICLNFGLAKTYADHGAYCYLRFDDTNPCTENTEFMESIQRDVKWLGFDWGKNLTFASDYFERLYQLAEKLIEEGKAYVCSLNVEQVKEYRGTLTEPGKPSPDRDRPIAENLDLFRRMRAGEFADGTYTLRAKIDMNASNINLRDPALYRIRKAHHHRTGDAWCIYPMYDYTHSLNDAMENITHSLCTLEFQDHRPLYDWFVENCHMDATPRQIEFSRLNLNYTVTSKRKLKQLVEEKHVQGWDDPRMPTICGMRRKGFTPASLRNFCDSIGISKQDSIIDVSLLEEALRDDLNEKALRRMAVLKPLKVTLENYDADQLEWVHSPNHPQKPEWGKRELAWTKHLWIDHEDFEQNPPEGFFRLSPGQRVRLMNAYVIECLSVVRDQNGQPQELICRYLPETLAGKPCADGVKVKGVIHWLSAHEEHYIKAEVRLYDRLFKVENPSLYDDLGEVLNPESLKIIEAYLEPALLQAQPEESFQFNRVGYFCADQHDHVASTSNEKSRMVFNRSVSLRDVAKISVN
jgi:glutaminyl-tRNA synthetase